MLRFQINKPDDDDDILSLYVTMTDLPMAPTSLRLDGVTRDSVTLRWDAPRDTGGVPLSGYIVEQQDGGKTAPGSAARWKVAAYVDPARTWWTVGGLIQGYEYRFRVRAENPDGAGSACALSSAVIPRPVVCKSLYWFLSVRPFCLISHRSIDSFSEWPEWLLLPLYDH